jgi:hypothetical protein
VDEEIKKGASFSVRKRNRAASLEEAKKKGCTGASGRNSVPKCDLTR